MLLHDAPEYVIGDMISPFKAVIGDSYKAVEKRLLAAIHLRFGLPAKLPENCTALIKTADRGAAYLEATRLAGFAAARGAQVLRPAAEILAALERDYLAPGRRKRPRSASVDRFERLMRARGLPDASTVIEMTMKPRHYQPS